MNEYTLKLHHYLLNLENIGLYFSITYYGTSTVGVIVFPTIYNQSKYRKPFSEEVSQNAISIEKLIDDLKEYVLTHGASN